MKKTNIILLSIDSLRADHLSCYGYHRKTDEALLSFMNQITVFKNAYTYSYPTMRAFPPIISSLPPEFCTTKFPWQIYKKISLPRKAITIADVLKHSGYYCIAHTGLCNFLTSPQGYSRGFDQFVGMLRQDGIKEKKLTNSFFSFISRQLIYNLRYTPTVNLVSQMQRSFQWLRESLNALTGTNIQEPFGIGNRSVNEVTDYVLNCITNHKNNSFFIWAHYLDTHTPLSPPHEYAYNPNISATTKRKIMSAIFKQRPISPPLLQNLIDLYDGAIRSVFYQIRRIFDHLKNIGLLDHTCIIITGDHGFGLWEHGYWEYPDEHFYNESTRVPLLIYHPKLIYKKEMIRTPVSLIDLAPTIIDICEQPPEPLFFGKSFATLLYKDHIFLSGNTWIETLGPPHRFCLIKGNQKIIYNKDSKQFLQCLDINDNIKKLRPEDKEIFLKDLTSYENKKATFTLQLKGN